LTSLRRPAFAGLVRRRRATTRSRAPLPAGFGTIWSTVALDLVGFGIILPLLPQYAERFGASPAVVGALFASFSVAQLVCAPLWGAVSDRVGRRPVLLLSLVGTALGSLLTGLAGSLPLLFAGRLVDGASGASVSVAHAAVADLAAPEERARLFGFLGAAFGLGFVAGPALGALATLGGTRLPFFVAAALAAANAVVASRRLPETHGRDVDHVSGPRGAARMPADAVVGLDGGSPLEGEALLGMATEAHADATPPAGLEGPAGTEGTEGGSAGLGRLVAVAFGSLVAFSAFEATFALFGERRLSFDPASTGAVFTAIGLVLALVQSSLVRPAVRRLGESRTLRLALLANAAGLAVLAAVHSWWLLAPALLLLVVGQGLATPSLTSAVAGRASARRRGGALGVQQSAGGLARVVGPVAGGLAFQHVGVPAPYLGGAVVMVLCAAAVAVPRR
jgi:MFS family permease